MTDPHLVTFTVKELLTRLDERLTSLDAKLDGRLLHMEERIGRVEQLQVAREHLINEHTEMKRDVEKLKTFRARFLPISLVAVLVAALALMLDVYLRLAY